jgi:hypothetical protein
VDAEKIAAPGLPPVREVATCDYIDWATQNSIKWCLASHGISSLAIGSLGSWFISVPEDRYSEAMEILRTAPRAFMERTTSGRRLHYVVDRPLVYDRSRAVEATPRVREVIDAILKRARDDLKAPQDVVIERLWMESRSGLTSVDGDVLRCLEGEIQWSWTKEHYFFQEFGDFVDVGR